MTHAQITPARPGYFLGNESYWLHTQQQVLLFFCTNLNSTELTDTMNCTRKQGNLGLFCCVKDAGMGSGHNTWTILICVNLNVLAYQNDCVDGPDLIYINPVNNNEMDQLEQFVKQRNMHVNNFKPQACQQHACLCNSELLECELVTAKHWSDFSNEDHVGVIPRWLQHSWSHIGSDVSGSHGRSRHKVPKQNAETSYSLGIFQKKGGSVCPTCCVFVGWLLNCVHTPHHPEHFWKTCWWIVGL